MLPVIEAEYTRAWVGCRTARGGDRLAAKTDMVSASTMAALLLLLEATENRVRARFRAASAPAGTVVAAVLAWVVLFGSEFLVLEVVALIGVAGCSDRGQQRCRASPGGSPAGAAAAVA